MKTRTGFVSNSSTSSFICNVCGEIQSGMDISLSEAGMQECVNGHIFCERHADKKAKTVESMTKKEQIDYILDASIDLKRTQLEEMNEINLIDLATDCESDCGVPTAACPICTLKAFTIEDLLAYTLNAMGRTQARVEEEIQLDYNSLKEMYESFKDES